MHGTNSQALRSLDTLLSTAGVTAVLLVDGESGACVLSRGGAADGDPGLIRLASRHAAAMRERARVAREAALLQGDPEEIVLTLARAYHLLLRCPEEGPSAGLFLCLVADREMASLALLRSRVSAAAAELYLNDEERELVRVARRHARPQGEPVAPAVPPLDYTLPPTAGVVTTGGDEEELPPFLRTESVLRLLGITEEGEGRHSHAPLQETDARLVH